MKTVIFQKTVIERIRSGEEAEITLGNLENGTWRMELGGWKTKKDLLE